MPLDLNLVGQPDSGYLTTGATDYANAVTAGKKSALELQAGAMQNEKYALDLSALKEKTARDTAISGRLPDLIGAADKAQLTAQNKADLMQYNPELANKIIATNDAKVKENISNFLGSSLLKLAHSTDAESDKTAILDAVNHYGIPLNLSDNPSPEELRNALMVAARGVDALKDTTMATSPTGERITTTRAGEVTDIKPAEKVKQPVVPALDAKGNEITKITPLGYGKTVKERKMSDGTWEKLGTVEPPAPRAAKDKFSKPFFDETMGAYVQRNLTTGQLNILDKGYEQGKPIEGEAPRKQAGAQEKQRTQSITIPAGQAIADIDNIVSLSPDVKFSMSQDIVGKGGSLTTGVRNFLARTSTDSENRMYETAFKGLNNAVARLSNAGYTFSKAQADAYDEAMRFTDKDTNETKVYALLTGIQHIREALKSSKMGSPEQRTLIKNYIHELEKYPTPKEFVTTTRKPAQSIGGMVPTKAQPTKAAQSVVQVKTADDYNRLPSGASYVDPNGVRRRKP